jgi:hypothetical protein
MTNELRDAEEVQEKAFRNEGTLVRCAMVIEALRAALAGGAHAPDCGWHKDWHSCSCGKFDAKIHLYMPECTGPIYCGCKENK